MRDSGERKAEETVGKHWHKMVPEGLAIDEVILCVGHGENLSHCAQDQDRDEGAKRAD